MSSTGVEPRDVERFWAKVDMTGDCWLWTAATNRYGYGVFGIRGSGQAAHRVAHELEIGPLDKGLDVDHTCHTRNCVKPRHLRAATRKQNAENRQGAMCGTKSGVRGVSWDAVKSRWVVQVHHNGKTIYGGYFSDVPSAALAAKELRLNLFTHSDMDKSVTS